ncbi:transcription-repair coupling factor [Pseudohaliea rubra]|uniref:Transcription-repair-coupling factor n=1 Tax=Pseudohaliea rubra DSM 19751 TaxID=1265313 RepID=A0A095VPP8_9GAMM|nr:transcription-repair coupling factor [Pseudohaliea rubra]KGE03370.1 Transcription-repair coupling factor [Pseudohaliea rubra DSM 19751]
MFRDKLLATPWPARAGTRTAIGPFPGSAASACIAELADDSRLLLVVAEDTQAALALERELPFFVTPGTEVLALPDWETLPYDHFSPHQDIVSERLETLYRLPSLATGILIVPIATLMHRLPPRDYVLGASLLLELGSALDVDRFRRRLERSGYRHVETVYEHGEFALRGALVDIFPMGSPLPYRIDLLDEEVDTLRTFDPETQRTVDRMDAVRLLPAREFPLTREAISCFQQQWYEQFEGDPDQSTVFTEVSAGRVPGGCEYYLPLFFEHCETLFEYLPDDTAVITVGRHYEAAQRFWGEITERHSEYGIDLRRPLLPPPAGFLPVEELYGQLKGHAVLELRLDSDAPVHVDSAVLEPPRSEDDSRTELPSRLTALTEGHSGPVLLCAESAGRREVLLEALAANGLAPVAVDSWPAFLADPVPLAIAVAPIDRGLYLGPGAPMLLCEAQLYGTRVAQRRRRKREAAVDPDAVFRDLNELRPGAPVVHLEHGVGRYVGLSNLAVDGADAEFLTLEYADGARLYVPVAALHLISRYSGSEPELAPLHRLGSGQWERARRKASEKASDVAAQLLEVYARREARAGFAFGCPREDYERFAAAFPFEETPDQEAAIAAVLSDMESERVMDRLVCGDVGFGKTEVAMRAAFVAVAAGKQVAMLVPTTLLAQQHHSSLADRFADWPHRVEVLSRFRTATEVRQIGERMAAGEIDILVGTHKLLQSDFRFKDLGLLIIDEEHRFGVKQKEAIKALRAQVDILTLTATPIPRTLNMALGGMRDLSIIATPPARRLSIKTFVREQSAALVKEAVLRETLRGGQVFYLHNEVRTIEETARKLRELLPDLSIAVAHGQLRETELERVMADFYHKRAHVLVCTTIIETGIDIPNANTIILERADRFGLAQLHQLRGRVGRSHHQAYAYLLCPPRSAMTADAAKRLDAIEAAGDLGAGYQLATHDLEIRGAGELLGDEQSGQIQSVGFGMYLEMLQRAVAALRRGEIPDLDAPLSAGTEINLHVPALIPEDYLPDTNTRLVLYKRIAAAGAEAALRDLQVEMIDRFGLLPAPVKQLFIIARLRIAAEPLGISSLELGPEGGTIEFRESTTIDPMSLVTLVQGDPAGYQLAGATRLRIRAALPEPTQRVTLAEQLFDRFAAGVNAPAA